jgi:uncharacterized membrane protein
MLRKRILITVSVILIQIDMLFLHLKNGCDGLFIDYFLEINKCYKKQAKLLKRISLY